MSYKIWNRNNGYLAAIVILATIIFSSDTKADAISDILNSKSPDRQKILEEGARKEGTLMFYSALTVDQGLRAEINAFSKKYPFIKAEFWRGTEIQISQKVLAEQRANNVQVDIVESVGVAGTLTRANALLPFESPFADAIPERYRDKTKLSAASRLNFFGIAYNTKLVPPGTQPKTYDDLLDPKWKGKLAWREDSVSGAILFITNLLMTRGEAATDAYLKKLVAQEIVSFNGSARTLVNRVIEGEYLIGINIFLHHPVISATEGAPAGAQAMEPVPSVAGTLVIPKGLKHPHAAMLFLDFFISKEGQEVMRDAQYFPVIDSVKPLAQLEPITPSLVNLKENYISDQQLLDYNRKAEALYKEYFR
jgi:iron(III) transport system substrate-binding protein